MRLVILLASIACVGSALSGVWLLCVKSDSHASGIASSASRAAVLVSTSSPLDVPIEAPPKEALPTKLNAEKDCPTCPGARHDGHRRDLTNPEGDEHSSLGEEWLPPPLPNSGFFVLDTLDESPIETGTWKVSTHSFSLSVDSKYDPVLQAIQVEAMAVFDRLRNSQKVGAVEDEYKVAIAGPRRILLRHIACQDFVETVYVDGKFNKLQIVHFGRNRPGCSPLRLVLHP